MSIQKSLESVKHIAIIVLGRVALDGVLDVVKLLLVKRSIRMTTPIFAAFGGGLVVGAGAALLLAPMIGKELRTKLSALMAMLPARTHAAPPVDSDTVVGSPMEVTKPPHSLAAG